MIYLMLNPNDITEVLGEVSDSQIKSELHITQTQLLFKLNRNLPFYKGTVLVEKKFIDKKEGMFDEVLIEENDKGSRWYATKDCKIYRVFKNGNKRELSIWKNHGLYVTKINDREVCVARIFAKNFIFPKLDKNYVVKVNGELKLNNIEILPLTEMRQKTGYMSSESRRKPIGIYENGNLVKTWPSAYKAGKDLFLSHQSIRDICDGKVKKKIYDLRYVQ